MDNVAAISASRPMKRLAVRVGHDAVWIAIAGLFCVVEGAVKLSEFTPKRVVRACRARRASETAATPSHFAVH